MLYLMEERNESVVFLLLNTRRRYELYGRPRRNQALNTGANGNPLFSLALLRSGAQILRAWHTREESANLRAPDRWIIEACANIAHDASYGRPEMQRASTIASRASTSHPAYMRFV